MSVSATFTMLTSTTSSSAPSATAMAIAHLPPAAACCLAGIGTADGARLATGDLLTGIDGEVDAHAGAQRDPSGERMQAHSHRHPLHDLGEVARCVVRR